MDDMSSSGQFSPSRPHNLAIYKTAVRYLEGLRTSTSSGSSQASILKNLYLLINRSPDHTRVSFPLVCTAPHTEILNVPASTLLHRRVFSVFDPVVGLTFDPKGCRVQVVYGWLESSPASDCFDMHTAYAPLFDGMDSSCGLFDLSTYSSIVSLAAYLSRIIPLLSAPIDRAQDNKCLFSEGLAVWRLDALLPQREEHEENCTKWEGCPCKITTAFKPCLNLVHAVDPADQRHWHHNPETSNWRICELQPCPHADPLNSIPRTRQFPDGSELVPLSFPSPTPTPEPETDLTASAALPFAALPTPVGSGPATPRPLSVLSHRSPSPTDTTDSHTTTSTISSMSTQSTANTTLESLLSRLVDQQQSQQAQLNAIKDAFKANKNEGAVIAKPAVFKGDADDIARFLPMFRNWASEQKALRIKEGAGVTAEDVGKLDNRKTIQSVLSFCEGGKAGCWAVNYLKQANTSMTDATVQFPFKGKWEVFEKQFNVQFGAANEKVDAIRELEHMKQGSKAVTV
ncbi:hypothetical protein PQX77_019462 [Marasmius sp. AFHP31]|nr:hypothetical protein PQX77_019462 [Marasmius sp. AFHP31]